MISGLVSVAMQMIVAGGAADLQATADAVKAPVMASGATRTTRTITYDVSSRGEVVGDIEEFRRIVADVLTDSRGWIRAGVNFVEVESGGSMHMILANPDVVGALSGCSSTLSCTVYPNVYLNDTRWMGGSSSYNDAGVSLLSYRQMVTNHEVGHYLGHGHITTCQTDAGLAPVMLQQSTGLRGCLPNAWPLPGELWYNRW